MKIFILFLAAHLVCTGSVFSQAEKFDIATFIPPQGWQRTDTNGSLSFFDSKTINGQTSYCQIILYPSSASAGTASKNFKSAWQNLVVSPTKSKAKPATQTEKTPDGWTMVTGAAPVSFGGLNYNSIVANITGFGKTMSVQVNLSGNDYAAVVEKFFNDLDLDSKAKPVKPDLPGNGASNTANVMNVKKSFTLDDYDFIVPDKWQSQRNNDHIQLLNPESGCVIRILGPQGSSGDLEKDAKAVFDMMYQGWQYQKSGYQQYDLSRGFLPKGLEYCMLEAGMSKPSADGSRYDGFETGAALIIKASKGVVIISVRHNSSMMGHVDCHRKYETWRRFFNSFTVKNIAVPPNNEDPSQKITGSWSMAESGGTGEYVFAANGNYALYGAIGTSSTSRDYNYEYLHIKTYAFQGDGSYTIAGNQLTLKNRSRNSSELVKFRFEKVNHGGTGWKDRIYMLKRDSYGDNEVCYEKSDK